MEFETPGKSSQKKRPASNSDESSRLDFRGAAESSRSSYRKLVMLVLMLIGVIYAMVELGKPERWYWLIPPESSEISPLSLERDDSELNSKTDFSSESGLAAGDRAESEDVELAVPADVSESKPEVPARSKFEPLDPSDYPASARRFWGETLRAMNSQQRRNLFLLLKRARHRQVIDASMQAEFNPMIATLRKARTRFHADLLNRATYADGLEKAALMNDHFEAHSIWERSESPALTSFLQNDPLSHEQQLALRRLQSMLDTLILEFVVDRTAQGWEGDSPAWGRMWERLMFEELPTPTALTHLELSAQPSVYRNRAISVRGWVRGAWLEDLPIPELGIKHLYVLVVRPVDSKVSPYFLYARELPTGFPAIEKKYQPLNRRIECEGLFFKIRTYLDTEKEVQTSPMILVESIETGEASSPKSLAAENRLAHPGWWFVGLFLLTLISIGVARFAYQTTKSIRFQPGPHRTREIHQSLGGLAENSEVKTNAERIRELYE